MSMPPTNARIEKLMRLHYALMEEPSFFYDKAIMEADKILCVAASDERQKLIQAAEAATQG